MFQSTHPHGVRRSELIVKKSALKFQSTHPHGVRHFHTLVTNFTNVFQSTHPHGVRRWYAFTNALRKRVSIHAPTRGATDTFCAYKEIERVSIHAPTRGATPKVWVRSNDKQSFNPRTHTGCDLVYIIDNQQFKRFNPRTHTGCDLAIRL